MTGIDPIPKNLQHIAIIMDGNGRWAKARGLDRVEGHKMGAQVVREIVTHARERGLRYLTLFAFSTENWLRPLEEVSALMDLLSVYLYEEAATIMKHDIRLIVIGDRKPLPESIQKAIDSIEKASAKNASMTLTLALSYGARQEIVEACRFIAQQVAEQKLTPEAIDEHVLKQSLYTIETPDPDILIRTSGEQRLSNFLLWQIAYSELFFTQTAWPDFNRAQFDHVIEAFLGRQRRFGQTEEQCVAQDNSKTDTVHTKRESTWILT
jgi:undecaprenyl diphosphate synthase